MEQEKFKELKKLEKVVEKLDRDLDSVIVEGYDDREVIKELGFTGKVFLSAEKTVEDLVEDVVRGSNRTAILTDFDSHGKKENKKIRKALEEKVNNSISSRNLIGKQLTKNGRMTIESARPLLNDKEQKFIDAALSRLYT